MRRDALGLSLTALCGGALALCLLLVGGLLALLAYHGLPYFWPRPLAEVDLAAGGKVIGEILERETSPSAGPAGWRVRMKVGNRDVGGADFRWLDGSEIAATRFPADVVLLERLEWGPFMGRLIEIKRGEQVLAAGGDEAWRALAPLVRSKSRESGRIRRFEKRDIGRVNAAIEDLRLEEKRRARAGDDRPVDAAPLEAEYEALAASLAAKRRAWEAETLVVETAEGQRKEFPVAHVVRAIRPNTMGVASKARLYASRVGEFLFDDPRESNTEGGIFPAIFGTVMMVFLMSIACAPLGVLAALYLREYARQGPVVRVVRIAVNNLAGVPSIVFGVFGLGFFVYTLGGSIDRIFFPEHAPTPVFGTGGILWASLTLALLTVPVMIVATEEGLAAVPRGVREGALALGATKLETTLRVVLPAAAPGILTGLILSMARAAGEVAPLMIVGMVKLAPALPLDGRFPFVHLERKFMHLGFHIYDVGFQSPNVEATKPLVYATALLLIVVVTAINLTAIAIRNRLRRKYASSAV